MNIKLLTLMALMLISSGGDAFAQIHPFLLQAGGRGFLFANPYAWSHSENLEAIKKSVNGLYRAECLGLSNKYNEARLVIEAGLNIGGSVKKQITNLDVNVSTLSGLNDGVDLVSPVAWPMNEVYQSTPLEKFLGWQLGGFARASSDPILGAKILKGDRIVLEISGTPNLLVEPGIVYDTATYFLERNGKVIDSEALDCLVPTVLCDVGGCPTP